MDQNTYLTRLYNIKLNSRPYNTLNKAGALGYATTESNGSHVNYICSVHLFYEGKFYQCTFKRRAGEVAELINHHDHHFEVDALIQKQLNCQNNIYLPSDKESIRDHILNDLAFLVACDTFPLKRVISNTVYDLIMKGIEFGQNNPNADPTKIFPKCTTLQIRNRIIGIANGYKEKAANQIKNFSHHGIAIDGGTVNAFHFLDVCLVIPSLSPILQKGRFLNPYNYKTIFMANDEVDSIQEKMIEAICELSQQNINITSITTDNIPTQILSFAPWSTESYLRSNKFNDPKIKRIIFCSCSSHVMHLVAKSVQEENAPSFIKNVYSKFFQASLHLDQFSEASIEKPPKPIRTRWLLVFNQIKFMRKHDFFCRIFKL